MAEREYGFEAVVDVFNVAKYALEARYWVVTPSGGRLWFYSAWNTYDSAVRALYDTNQLVVANPHFEKYRKEKENER